MTKKRLWIISELFYPETTSTGYFLTEIGLGLSETHDVRVLCGQPSYSERGMKAAAHETWRGMDIRRVLSTNFDKDRLVLRIINALTFAVSCMINAFVHIKRGDVVLVVTNPPIVYPLIILICRIKGARSLLLIHDVYPDILWATGLLRKESMVYRLLDRIFAWPIAGASAVIVLGRDMQKLICAKTRRAPDEVIIIPNWADIDEIVPLAREENPFAAAHCLGNDVVIQFSGNIGRTHDVAAILNAARHTVDDASIRFMFIGYGAGTDLVRTALLWGDLAQVDFLPRQSREMLGPMLASATAVVIAFNDKMLGLSVPSRMYNVMAARTPIIAMADTASELAMTVEEGDCGWVLPQGDGAQLASLARWLTSKEGQAERDRKAGNARALATERFRYAQIIESYRLLIARL
jgi:glycosyltransferase involved in cell wall biosynthesis